jgi:hypothetical protein
MRWDSLNLTFVGVMSSAIVGSQIRPDDRGASVLLIWSKSITFETLRYVIGPSPCLSPECR